MAANDNMIFRSANIDDMKVMRELIQELADYVKMSDSPKQTEDDLIRDAGLNGGEAIGHFYLLEYLGETNEKPKPIGFAACCICYSSWLGKTYFLDDIYVRPDYRSIGAGSRLFREVAAKALEHGCKRLDYNVLAWNPARKFYAKMGATDNTEAEQRHYYRLHEQEIKEQAKQLEAEKL